MRRIAARGIGIICIAWRITLARAALAALLLHCELAWAILAFTTPACALEVRTLILFLDLHEQRTRCWRIWIDTAVTTR